MPGKDIKQYMVHH